VESPGFTPVAGSGAPNLVGRGPELQLLAESYREAAGGTPRVVLIEGEPGIGKTALLSSLLADLTEAHVISVQGLETEADIDFALLDQMLRAAGLDSNVLDGGASQVDVGLRLLEDLGALQTSRPVVVALDDAQWADAASLRTLLFALRRLTNDRVLALLAVRSDDAWTLPDAVRRLAAARGTTVRLGPLKEAELAELARGYDLALPMRGLRHLAESSGGNPLFAHALLDEAPADAWLDPDQPLPAPRSLAHFVRQRTSSLPAPAQDLVEAVAVLGSHCTIETAAALAQLTNPSAALDAAVSVGLLRVEKRAGITVVAFAHPLYLTAAYTEMGLERRASLHLRAAELAEDIGVSLRHRAAAALGPDEDLASELDAAAANAAERGTSSSAAALLHAARNVTSDSARREQFSLRAVECALDAGGRARRFADGIDAFPPTAMRDYVLGRLAMGSDSASAAPLLERAWNSCDEDADPILAARIATYHTLHWTLRLDGEKALEWALRAAALAPPDGPDASKAQAFKAIALGQLGRMSEARAVFASQGFPPGGEGLFPRVSSGWLYLVDDDLGRARDELDAVVPEAVRMGHLTTAAAALSHLSRTHFTTGAWDESVVCAERAVAVVDEFERELAPFVWAPAVAIMAARGDWRRAERYLRAATDHALNCEDHEVNLGMARASLAYEQGRPDEVARVLQPLLGIQPRSAVDEPGFWPWQDLYAHALIDLERLDEAEAFLSPHESLARVRNRPSVIVKLTRARGRLDFATGKHDEAREAFESALLVTERQRMPYERALVEMSYGEILRRLRQRRSASAQLNAARGRLESLGARPALERCERELQACGLRPAKRKDPDPRKLTPQELAVSRLAAGGMTNRGIAAEMMVSVRTVEYHLGNVYSKLGLRSRAQLESHLAERDAEPEAG
jgi:DNA-binding CsgD family transcriptional regulator